MTKQIIMPGMPDEDGFPGKPYIVTTQYNGILYWGRIVSFTSVAVALWIVFWAIKRKLVAQKESGHSGKRSHARTDKPSHSGERDAKRRIPRKKAKSRVTPWRKLKITYRHETNNWVLWGGATASAVVVISGVLSALYVR